MADHSLPVLTSPYADYTAYLKARLDDLLIALDPAYTTATNFPTHAQRFSSVLSKWQTFNGTSWVDSATTYAISVSGNAASATTLQTARNINGVSFNGSANISVNTNNSVTFNNAGTGDVSGSVFNGSAAKTISYNTLGAPSITGTNASGTWAISVSGNAATASALETARNINGVAFNGSAAISINLNNSLTFNNGGSGVASGSTFNGSLAKTISYNTVGAPSTTGTGASGTWPINVTGSASSATTAGSATSAGSATNATNLVTTNFTVQESGGMLKFLYGTTLIATMSTAGVFTALGAISSNDALA